MLGGSDGSAPPRRNLDWAFCCVVFDVDDTLYLEIDYVISGFRAVDRYLLESYDIVGFFPAAMSAFAEGARGDIFNRALTTLGHSPEPTLIRQLVKQYRSHLPQIGLLSDARQALNAVRPVTHVAVLSDGPTASQRAKVAVLGLTRWTESVLLTDEWGVAFRKPHPRAFEAVQDSLGGAPESFVYVADNPVKDFAAPHALGWRTVRVRRTGSLHAGLPSRDDVDLEVPDLSDCRDLLQALAAEWAPRRPPSAPPRSST